MNEAIVYFVVSPERGPEHRTFPDEDVQAVGGIHALEMLLEEQSYWFVQLGEVRGKPFPHGVSFPDSEFARLPEPAENKWRVGRRNPAFSGSELERHVFEEAFEAIDRTLDSWKRDQGGSVEVYALKELKISSDRLLALISGLRIAPRVYEIAEITIVKYWYDKNWPQPPMPYDDVVLAEFSIRMPIQVGWSAEDRVVRVDVMSIASC
jgi:hypothetical protein